MKKGKITKLFILGQAVLISVTLNNCNCGKKSGNITAPEVISFTPSDPPVDNSVYLEQVSNNGNEITLNIKVKVVSNVYALAGGEINYDGSKINYVSSSEGSFLKQDGASTIFDKGLDNKKGEGALIIGCSMTGTSKGINGDGVIAVIVLKAIGTQKDTVVSFVDYKLKLPPDYDNDVNNDNIAGVKFINGNLTYQ